MNSNVIFANSFGDFFLYGWLLPVISSIVLTAIICGIVWLIFKFYKILLKSVEEVKYYIEWRWSISKQVRLFGKPVEQTTYYTNGKIKTRRYFF